MSLRSAALALGVAAAALGVGATSAAADTTAHGSCFLSTNWDGWKSPDPNTILLRITLNRVFRLDLAHPSNQLNDPSVHLLNKVRGSAWICSPVDLDLSVVDDRGMMREPLFVKAMTELTPDEVKAIPAKYRP
jgi:hypothetical protein